MPRLCVGLLFLALLTGCSASADTAEGNALDPEGVATYAVVTNDDSVAYSLYMDGVRFGRIGSSLTRRFQLPAIPIDDRVQFTARSTRGNEFSWDLTVVQRGGSVDLRIPNRGQR